MSPILLAILSSLPILSALILLIFFQLPASLSMPLSYLLALLLAILFWELPLSWILAATMNGFLTALSILFILLGALLLLNTLKMAGSIGTILAGIYSISRDRRIQALILSFGFASLIEGASGFGTAGALTAPLLVGIGFPPLAAAIITLIGHAPAVSFGAVGTPILGGIGIVLDTPEIRSELTIPFIEWVTRDVAIWNANFHFPGASFIIPLIMVLYLTRYFGRKGEEGRGLEIWPLALLVGLSFAITQNLMARFTGPELPSMVGGMVVMALLYLSSKYKILIPSQTFDFPRDETNDRSWQIREPSGFQMSLLAAFWPYILIFLLLFLTRMDTFLLKEYFIAPSLSFTNLFGSDLSWEWSWLYNPGVFPFIPVTIYAWFFYRLSLKKAVTITRDTFRQILPSTTAMSFAIAMAQIMMHSGNNPKDLEGMLPTLAGASLYLFGGAFPLVSPWIGALGSFISGSNTVSNILFAGYQYEVAQHLGLSRTIMVALQSTGAAVGNMITIHNVVAILTVTGSLGKEGLVIKRNLLPLILYLLIVGLLGLLSFLRYPNLF